MKKWVFLLLVVSLAACSKKHDVACNGDDSTSVMTSLLKDALVKQVTSALAADGNGNANVNVDSASIRATVEKISIRLEDVLTTKSDPNSTKKFCESTLKLSLPTDVIASADATRNMLSLNSTRQGALQSGVEFDADTVKANMSYSVQPTDDGKKIYGSTEGDNAALAFASTIVEQSLLKSALERQKAAQAQQQQQAALQAQQQQAVVAQAQAAEAQAALDKAQADIKSANDAINVVWNAGNKEWRQSMLPEQRLWLAQRENDCKIKALDSGGADSIAFQTSKLNCEVQMTVDRTQVLKTSLQQSIAQVNSQTSQ
ncbi:MAG TPA: lysozyme inhibitor LprI family protein [Paraburkholderia sp.]|uniref:lysozyme inhibitor LprI family protein n=1 Tax=Paraburkholderia sp. TaxID=1926495 RepID=UPI002ED41180